MKTAIMVLNSYIIFLLGIAILVPNSVLEQNIWFGILLVVCGLSGVFYPIVGTINKLMRRRSL